MNANLISYVQDYETTYIKDQRHANLRRFKRNPDNIPTPETVHQITEKCNESARSGDDRCDCGSLQKGRDLALLGGSFLQIPDLTY